METYYLLIFRTSLNELATMKVPYGVEFPEVQDLKDAMDRIIATGIVDMDSGNLTSRERVDLINTLVEEFDLQ